MSMEISCIGMVQWTVAVIGTIGILGMFYINTFDGRIGSLVGLTTVLVIHSLAVRSKSL